MTHTPSTSTAHSSRVFRRKKTAARFVVLIKHFLFYCAALEKEIVRRHEFRLEHGKYMTIGLTVLFTAVLASFSGGYAIYSIFPYQQFAVGFGLLWGFIILTLDRLVILGLYKSKPLSNLSSTGGRQPLSFSSKLLDAISSYLGLLMRILLAATLGVIISEPIKLRFFKKQIDREHAATKIRLDINDLKAKINKKEKERIVYEGNLASAIGDRTKEKYKLSDPGEGGNWQRLDDRVKDIETQLKDINTDVKLLDTNLDKLNSSLNRILVDSTGNAQLENQTFHSDTINLFDQYLTLKQLEKEKNLNEVNEIKTISWFITFLFIVIELLPVFSKLSIGSGVYDRLLRDRISKTYQESRINEAEFDLFEKKKINQLSIDELFSKHEKDITVCDLRSDLELNNRYYEARITQYQARINAESELQAQLQQEIDNFKKRVMLEVITKAGSNLSDKAESTAATYANKISQQIDELLSSFEQAYQTIIQKRRSRVKEKALTDEKIDKGFTDLEEAIREITLSFFMNVRSQTDAKAMEEAVRLAGKAATSMNDTIESLVDDMDVVLNEITNQRKPSRKDTLKYDFGAGLDQELEATRSQAIYMFKTSLTDELNKQLATLPAEAAERVKVKVLEMINNAVENLGNPPNPLQ